MKQFYRLLLSLLISQCAFSQIYTPIDTANLPIRKEESEKHKIESKKFISVLKKEHKGKEGKYIKKNYEASQKDINKDLLDGSYIFDDKFDQIVDSLVDILRKHNPNIPENIEFYISRNISLNAMSMGDNTFVINLGTFYYLDNENQLAAIISHELGHLILQHRIQSLKHSFYMHKKKAKSNLSEIRQEKYNRGTKALEKYKAMLYANGDLRKRQEREADSLGYVLYKNTFLQKSDYLNIYQLMAEYDTIKPKGLKDETYQKVFNLPNQPFKKEWFKQEDFSDYDYSMFKERFNEDSLKSHPETTERINHLKKLFPELDNTEKPSEPDSSFVKLQQIAEFERMSSLEINEDYGDGIYLCLLEIQRQKHKTFHEQWLGKYFDKIYEARKNYTLNRHLDRIDPKNQSESYQQFLNFMWNLNLSELKNIADFYHKKSS